MYYLPVCWYFVWYSDLKTWPHTEASSAFTSKAVQFRGFCVWFIGQLSSNSEELLAAHLTPKLDDHPLLAVRYCLVYVSAATVHTWRPFLCPQPEDVPCRGDRDPLDMGWGYYPFILSSQEGGHCQKFHKNCGVSCVDIVPTFIYPEDGKWSTCQSRG
jgi:hypothetical protein